jgi:hypothetical protein
MIDVIAVLLPIAMLFWVTRSNAVRETEWHRTPRLLFWKPRWRRWGWDNDAYTSEPIWQYASDTDFLLM